MNCVNESENIEKSSPFVKQNRIAQTNCCAVGPSRVEWVPMEIAVLKAIAAELAAVLPGMRLIELAEGNAGEVYLVFKGEGGKKALLIGPRPGLPRLYLISGK